MREPQAPAHESTDADIAADFAARAARAEILMSRLEAVRRKQLEQDAKRITHTEPEIDP